MWPRTSTSSTTPPAGVFRPSPAPRLVLAQMGAQSWCSSVSDPSSPRWASEPEPGPARSYRPESPTGRWGSYLSSPASIARLRRFCFGASGQVAYGMKRKAS